MKRANVLGLVCVVALVVAPLLAHGADSGASSGTTSAKASAPAKSATKSAAKSSKRASKTSRTTAQKTSKTTTAARIPAAGPRRLEDIHIEGEVPVPQVLFITARDQRRFLESHHDMYLRTSRELGASTPLPARVVLTPAAPAAAPAKSGDGR